MRFKFYKEYLFHCSPNLLFKYFSTPSGLEAWFADRVNENHAVYSFEWDGEMTSGELIEMKLNSFIRFQMDEYQLNEYLEFKIVQDNLTRELSVQVTDFCDLEESKDFEMVWDNSISKLKEQIGA